MEGLEGGTETGEEALDRLWDFVVILGVLALEGLKRLVEGDELCLEDGVHLGELFLSLRRGRRGVSGGLRSSSVSIAASRTTLSGSGHGFRSRL